MIQVPDVRAIAVRMRLRVSEMGTAVISAKGRKNWEARRLCCILKSIPKLRSRFSSYATCSLGGPSAVDQSDGAACARGRGDGVIHRGAVRLILVNQAEFFDTMPIG
jgi:hypothetical protein